MLQRILRSRGLGILLTRSPTLSQRFTTPENLNPELFQVTWPFFIKNTVDGTLPPNGLQFFLQTTLRVASVFARQHLLQVLLHQAENHFRGAGESAVNVDRPDKRFKSILKVGIKIAATLFLRPLATAFS